MPRLFVKFFGRFFLLSGSRLGGLRTTVGSDGDGAFADDFAVSRDLHLAGKKFDLERDRLTPLDEDLVGLEGKVAALDEKAMLASPQRDVRLVGTLDGRAVFVEHDLNVRIIAFNADSALGRLPEENNASNDCRKQDGPSDREQQWLSAIPGRRMTALRHEWLAEIFLSLSAIPGRHVSTLYLRGQARQAPKGQPGRGPDDFRKQQHAGHNGLDASRKQRHPD